MTAAPVVDKALVAALKAKYTALVAPYWAKVGVVVAPAPAPAK